MLSLEVSEILLQTVTELSAQKADGTDRLVNTSVPPRALPNKTRDMLVVFPNPIVASSSSISYAFSCQNPKRQSPMTSQMANIFHKVHSMYSLPVSSILWARQLQHFPTCTSRLELYSRYLHVYSWIRGTKVATSNASWCIYHKGKKSLSFSQHLPLSSAPQVPG